MEKPSLSEVKEYFKNAAIVECAYQGYLRDISKLEEPIRLECEEYWIGTGQKDTNLWDKEKGYAKILTYKNTEPKFEITKEQVLELSEKFGSDNSSLAKSFLTEHLKRMFPEVFENVLEVGKWYYQDTYGKSIFKITGIEGNTVYGYGFNYKGIYKEDSEWFCINDNKGGNIRLSTTEEVTEALKNEALKRYRYKQNLSSFKFGTQDDFYFSDFRIEEGIFKCGDYWLMKDGVWATVIKDVKTIKEAEELLKELGHNLKIV